MQVLLLAIIALVADPLDTLAMALIAAGLGLIPAGKLLGPAFKRPVQLFRAHFGRVFRGDPCHAAFRK